MLYHMVKLLVKSNGQKELVKSSNGVTILSSSFIGLAVTTILMMSESAEVSAFRSDGCLDLEGLKSGQQYLDGYTDAHHDFVIGLGQKNLHSHHDHQTQVYSEGYDHGWSDARRGVLNPEC